MNSLTKEQRSDIGRKGAAARWKNHVPQKNNDSRIFDGHKSDELVYSAENLTDAKKSETYDALTFVLDRLHELNEQKKRLLGGRLNSQAGVDEMMVGGAIIELGKLVDWLRARHPVKP